VSALQEKLTALRARRTTYRALVAELTASGDTQISQTDPDSRSMRVGTGVAVCYNVQTAVDAKHKLIVAHDVVNAPTDQAQLSPMAIAAQAILGAPDLHAVADRGYYSGPEILACLDAGITPTVPKPHTSANAKLGLFTKEHFQYDAVTDTYECPAGGVMTYGYSTVERGRGMRYYRTTACMHCAIKTRCTRSKGARRITRWEEEAILDAMEQRHAQHPERSALRKALAEHPFGTMKRWMDHGYFLCRGLVKVGAEFSLTVFAYNLKRAMTIVGVPRLIAALA
jgi:transposase